MKKNWFIPIGLTVLALTLAGRAWGAVASTRDWGPLGFSAAELAAARRVRAAQTRVVRTVAGSGAPETFRVRVRVEGAARAIQIEGADAAGAMAGAMEVAETIRLGGPAAVPDVEKTPHLRVRGMKFNAPLDARTP